MQFSKFGMKFTARSGILELMDDMAGAMESGITGEKTFMLGGGNPAHIPSVNEIWKARMRELLADGLEFDRMMANYDAPRGKTEFLQALSAMLRTVYGWKIDESNIAITNGSQSAFFILFNLFAGRYRDGSTRRVLFPIVPEYIGYADQSVHGEDFTSRRPLIRETGPHRFKYGVDFASLDIDASISAICVSRPTNPTGNVLSDEELRHLAGLARDSDIPLIVDNAYGLPFPGIVFTDATPYWDENVVLCMSLSKLGLPSSRTGIVIARPEIIQAVSAMNAVANLANGSLGQVMTLPMVRDASILELGRTRIRPFYEERSRAALAWIDASFEGSGVEWSVHESEGAIFLWVWFRNLPVSTQVLYERLKARRVVVVPGRYFFFGDDQPGTAFPGSPVDSWRHRDECIRISYAQDPNDVRRGIEIIGEELRAIMREEV